MQMKLARIIAAFLVGLQTATGARHAALRTSWASKSIGVSIGNNDAAGNNVGAGGSAGQSGTRAAVTSMVGEMLEGRGKGPKIRDIVKTANSKIDLEEAIHQLDGQLPEDVSSLVRLTSKASADSKAAPAKPFSEASMQKARKILNNMVVQAQQELDDVLFDCKEFDERNRGTYEQVVNDLARLGSQLASLGEKRVDASSGISEKDSQRKHVEELLETATQVFTTKKTTNSAELTRRKNDLAVFDFILNLTACKPGQTFVQLGSDEQHVTVCDTNDGIQLNFDNKQLQAQVEKMMTPDARLALREALGQASGELSLAQHQVSTRLTNSTTTTPAPVAAAAVVPVQEGPAPGGQWKKCVDGKENCGLLHDLMSLEWGAFKDQVDELTAKMAQNQQEFDLEKKNTNEQLTVIGDAKTKHMEALAAAISHINADTEEMNEKDEQKRELTREYDSAMSEFKAKITEILFTKMCAVKKVRNGLLIHSAKTPPSNISDCDVSDWASKLGECYSPDGQAILCDDTCPRADPYKCGGKEMMKRDIVTVPNSVGIKCPPLERPKRCGQKKCPVSCSMSSWSGWSKCTKACEGGVQSRTRSILLKPRNGGTGCDAVQEERSCNTGSCDRDCTLYDWSDWAPCSMACSGGTTTRTRKVLVPIRGQGKCPTKTSRNRFQQIQCNEQACIGDEICIAQQDLIIALDASGSLKESGFEVLRNFAVNLTKKYQPKYFGIGAVQIGVALFGNGHLLTMPDGTTSIESAIQVQPLTSDFGKVRQRLAEQKWQRGFTNMAQALAMAETMLSQGGREGAQSAVLVLSDGKYSFEYQTAEKARELKDKNIQVFMAPVVDFDGKELRKLKQWASQPWETNYELVPGLAALENNNELFVQKFVAKFCPDSFSPSAQKQKDAARRYMLIHENGWPDDNCGKWFFDGQVGSKDDCAMMARQRNLSAFAFGRTHAAGRCYSEAIKITQQFWDQFSIEQSDPPCPSGRWLFNPFYDTYAINPSTLR